MAEGAISFALEQLRDLLYEEGRLLSGVGGEVKELEMQLLEMKCLIEDADKRRHESGTVKNFIAEIRDLADRAEDAIELYAVRVSSKRGRGVKKVLRRYACILKECHSLHQIDSEISEIKSDLERVNKQMQDYGIIKKIVDGEESSDDKARKTYPDFKEGDCFVGMEKELKQLVSLIEGEEHRFISVWGMGGLGKTTIAREVYNQMKRKANSFDRFAWVCISQQFKIRSVLEEALKQLDPQRSENASSLQQIPQVVEDLSKMSEDDLIRRLHEIQRAHRCLIVMDDLWNISHWNDFKHAFRAQGLKSKVLVTTRKQVVAETIGFPVKHGNLNMDEAWELLKKKAFPHNNIPEHSQEKLHEIGEKMLGKCGCLPLAIYVLGGVLRKKSINDWESVRENMNEYMFKAEGDDEDEYQIRGVLDLSYEDLPYYLKPCFLYLGTLKEDESVDALVLYMMWIAQGMISSEDDPMGILGKLPFLSALILFGESFVGEELTCTASSFPRLKKLHLSHLPKLREWRVEAGAMPLLSQLTMYSCRDLEKVPNGLSSISTLQKLKIAGMPELAKRVAPSGEDFAKVNHIPSITID